MFQLPSSETLCHVSLDSHGNLTRRRFLQVTGASLAGAGFLGQISLHADELKKDGRACILVWPSRT